MHDDGPKVCFEQRLCNCSPWPRGNFSDSPVERVAYVTGDGQCALFWLWGSVWLGSPVIHSKITERIYLRLWRNAHGIWANRQLHSCVQGPCSCILSLASSIQHTPSKCSSFKPNFNASFHCADCACCNFAIFTLLTSKFLGSVLSTSSGVK